jgi:hypothetical protein
VDGCETVVGVVVGGTVGGVDGEEELYVPNLVFR